MELLNLKNYLDKFYCKIILSNIINNIDTIINIYIRYNIFINILINIDIFTNKKIIKFLFNNQ